MSSHHQNGSLALQRLTCLHDRGGMLSLRLSDSFHKHSEILPLGAAHKWRHIAFVCFSVDCFGLKRYADRNDYSKKGRSLQFLHQLLNVPRKNVLALHFIQNPVLNDAAVLLSRSTGNFMRLLLAALAIDQILMKLWR